MKKNRKLNISWRILCVFLLICLAVSLCPISAFAANSAGEGIEWSIVGDTLTISGTGEMRDFTENDTPPWHKQRDKIRVVIVSDGVTSVGDVAFYKYDGIVSVILADSVKEIGAYAFSDCTSLKMIALGQGLEHIGESAFARCQSLMGVRFPESLKSIGKKAFYRCSALVSVYIPKSVTSLGNMIFTYCDSLVGASVEASVDAIPEWMFCGCSNLSEVVLDSSIKSAEDRAFYGCESFLSLYYPSENKSELVESIKSTSIPTFSEEDVLIDTPTDNELEGATGDFENDKYTYTEVKTSESDGAIITTKLTEVSKLENFTLSETTSSVEITALIDGERGWDELVARIRYVIDNGLANSGHIYVFVNLQSGDNVPAQVLSQLAGEKIQLEVCRRDGSVFGIDCERIGKEDAPQSDLSIDCEVKENSTLSEKYKETLDGASTYDVKYNSDTDMSFSSSIFVGKENAHSVATIYKVNDKQELERVQSAVIDKEGNATFYLESISSGTSLVLGIGVKGETVENAIIPDSVAVDQYGLLDRYRPIEYASVEEREFMGMTSWQFALAVIGVVAAIVIVVAVVAVIIYRKKRIELIHKMKKTRA